MPILNTFSKLIRPQLQAPSIAPQLQRPSLPGYGQTDDELTQAQQELLPIIGEIKQEKEGAKGLLNPLMKVFDLLQRTNYASANAVQAILDKENLGGIFREAWEGLSGKDKTTYKDVLEKAGLGEGKVLGAGREGKFLGDTSWADILGFGLDVVLDPLTYVNPFSSASKGAAKAATSYADDAVRMAMKKFGIGVGKTGDDLAKIAKGAFNAKHYDNLLSSKGAEAANKYFIRTAGGEVAQSLNAVYKNSYKYAIRTPAEQLRKEMGEQVGEIVGEFGGKVGTDDALRGIERIRELLPGKYVGAGERRRLSVLGKEIGLGVRDPNMVARSFDILKESIGKSKTGQNLQRGWWSAMNNGPIGEIRRKLGFKNPYQRIIRLNELDAGENYFLRMSQDNMKDVLRTTNQFSDEIKQKYVAVSDEAARINRRAGKVEKGMLPIDALRDENVLRKLGIAPEEVGELTTLAADVWDLTRGWRNEAQKWIKEGYLDEMGDIAAYLPTVFKDPKIRKNKYFTQAGTSGPSWTKTRKLSRSQTVDFEAQKIAGLFDIPTQQAKDMVTTFNLTGFEMDLDQLLMVRGFAQAQAAKRVNLLKTFKEFGVPNEGVEKIIGQVPKSTKTIPSLGLSKIDDKALEGLWFDRETVEVLGRVTAATDPKNVSKIQSMFSNYMSWWKGIVTMTTGFHARNHLSNNITGFMKHGVEWVNPRKDMEGIVASLYAIEKGNAKSFLKDVGITEGFFNRTLSKTYGSHIVDGKVVPLTVKDLADMMVARGLLSEAQMGFSAKSVMEKLGQKATVNPLSQRFIGRSASMKIGSVIENSSKFKSFMLTYADQLKRGKNLTGKALTTHSDEAIEYAMRDAKKWFLDYSDLTQFEQKVMKNVIPFYTWLRKNIVNQVEGIVAYPQMFAVFPKLQEAMEMDDPGFDPDLLPDWMKDLGMFPLSATEDGRSLLFRPDVPFSDLNKIPLIFEEGKLIPRIDPSELKNDVINATSPIIKTIMSGFTEKGYDFFRKRELKEFEKAPHILQLLTRNPEALSWMDGIINVAGGRGLDLRIGEDGKLEMNAKFKQTLENNFPLIRTLNYMMYTGNVIVPGLEEAIEKATGAKSDYDKLEQFFQVMSFNTGIKLYPFEGETAEDTEARNIYYEAQRRRTEASSRTPEAAVRRNTFRTRETDIMRRLGL